MLKRLIIHNLAIFENVDVSFQDGFSVLLGETGAGKSLMIDSLSLLLGMRASSELIRSGESKASVTGYFSVERPELSAYLSKINVPINDDEIVVERLIGINKNAVKINSVPVSLNDLIKISKYLANIHSQFDFEKILNPENYLDIIDGFSFELSTRLKDEYTSLLNQYKEKKEEYNLLLEKKAKLEEARDFYEYQYGELKAADLKEGEEEEISSEISLLRNYDKIYSLVQETNEIINGSFMDDFYRLSDNLAKLANYQKQYEESHEKIDERYYEIEDVLNSLKKEFRSLDYDPNRLNDLEQRDSDLSSLQRKYKKSIPELIAYRDELGTILGKNSSFEDSLEEKKEEMLQSLKKTISKAKELTLLRKRNAKTIEKELTHSLKDLLLKVRFQILFRETKEDETSLKENGIDDVDFLIETNIGEGLKPLSKVISGGEASRIMLAFKALFIKANRIPTIIFDEIDTGISGETAQAVARKIKEISLTTQVISITHMPQVASLSDHPILISKTVKDGRTYSSVKELSLEEKIRQIAYLISGGKVTEKQLEYAKEMVLGN
ncbi:MAG TPA: DNA repair protein RecN [Firmicutes bacterium]|nr:DNA repair protein RecN [Bacillota bacterium]